MSSATLREARSKRKAFDSEIQYYKQEVARITSGSTLRIEFDKLEAYQQELHSLDSQCYGWKRKITGLKSKLSKKDDRSQYKEAVALIRAFDSQSMLMNQLRDFFALAANAAEEAEEQAKRRAKKVTAALNDALKAMAGIVGGRAKQKADSLASVFKAVADSVREAANNPNDNSLAGDADPWQGDTYSSNGYLSCEQMQANARYISDRLTEAGWSKEAIAALLGNMQTESTLNPGIWQSLNENNMNGGFGLVQWTPARDFFAWAEAEGLDPYSIDTQITRILAEANGEVYQWQSFRHDSDMSFAEFVQSNKSPEELAEIFLYCYERPAERPQPKRGTQAREWYDYL